VQLFSKKEKAPLSDHSKTPLPFMSPFIHPHFPIVKPLFEKILRVFFRAFEKSGSLMLVLGWPEIMAVTM
jgi:hypothetical protein